MGAEDTRYYTVEMDHNLPLSEKVHQVNDLLCMEVSSTEKCSLEKIETQDGYLTLTYRLWGEKPD